MLCTCQTLLAEVGGFTQVGGGFTQIGSFPPRGQIKNALKTPREPPVAGDASHPLYNYCIDELGYLRQVRVKQTVTLSCLTNIV